MREASLRCKFEESDHFMVECLTFQKYLYPWLYSSLVCISSAGVQTAEPKVELWFAVSLSSREKIQGSCLCIYHTRHHFHSSVSATYHLCVLQGSGSSTWGNCRTGKRKEENAQRFVQGSGGLYDS